MIKHMLLSAKKIYLRPHILYIVIGGIVALTFALVTPPFQGPDEEVHFFRSYQLARGDIMLQKGEASTVGSCLPTEIYQTVVDTSYSPNIRGYTTAKYNPSQIDELLVDSVNNPSHCRFVDTTNTYSYNPLAYLPTTLGVATVNSFNGSPLFAMYMARIFSVVVTVLLFSLAIYLIPKRKYLFLVIFLTPMLLFQQAVVSIDGFSYAILAIFIAYIIRLRSQAVAISNKQWTSIAAMALLVCLMKPLLFVFVTLVLLLAHKSRLKSSLIVMGAIIFTVLVATIVSYVYPGVTNVTPDGVNQAAQIENLADRPLRALRVAWNTYMNPYGDGQTVGVVGVFGAADTRLPLWMFALSVINLALAALFATKSDKLPPLALRGKLLLLAILLGYFAAVNAAMYVAYSPVNFDIFYGVQGRYFLPLLIAVPILMSGSFVLAASEWRRMNKGIVLTAAMIAILAIGVVIQRYYLYTP